MTDSPTPSYPTSTSGAAVETSAGWGHSGGAASGAVSGMGPAGGGWVSYPSVGPVRSVVTFPVSSLIGRSVPRWARIAAMRQAGETMRDCTVVIGGITTFDSAQIFANLWRFFAQLLMEGGVSSDE